MKPKKHLFQNNYKKEIVEEKFEDEDLNPRNLKQ